MTDTCIDIVALAQQTAPTDTLMTVTAFDDSRLSRGRGV